MPAIVVVDEHVFGRLDRAGDDVPARGHQLVAFFQWRVLRQAAGGDDDHIRFERQYIVLFGPCVVTDFDA
jgi:hypothetical protein